MAQRAVDLIEKPIRIQALPIDDRGYPVPWFVDWLNDVPEFRAMSKAAFVCAVQRRCCWICGQHVNRDDLVFALGPMCVITRTTAEPGGHWECMEYSARVCPFLTLPRAKRRELEGGIGGSCALLRNPGVIALWQSRRFEVMEVGPSAATGYLLRVGDPKRVGWFAEGRTATRAEVDASVESGFPVLEQSAREDPNPGRAVRDLMAARKSARHWWPAP